MAYAVGLNTVFRLLKKMQQNRGTKRGAIDSSFAQKRKVFKKEWIKTLHTAIYVE